MSVFEALIDPKRLAFLQNAKLRPEEYRAALDQYLPPGGSNKYTGDVRTVGMWDAYWPDSAVLMGIGVAHTGLDLSYRKNGAFGMFAISPGPFGAEDTFATDPMSLWVDPDVFQRLQERKTEQSDWIGCFLNQLWLSESAVTAAWRHPDPRVTVWRDNLELGDGLISLPTVTYRGISDQYRMESDQNYDELIFRDLEGNPLSKTTSEILWVLASRAAIYAEAWWNPTKARRIVGKALQEFSADHQTIGLDSVIAAAGAAGETSMVQRLVQYHAAIVYAMTQNPFCWMKSGMPEHEGYQRKTLTRWLKGEAALDTLAGMADDVTGALGGAASSAGWMLWALVGAAAIGIMIYAYGKGGGGK